MPSSSTKKRYARTHVYVHTCIHICDSVFFHTSFSFYHPTLPSSFLYSLYLSSTPILTSLLPSIFPSFPPPPHSYLSPSFPSSLLPSLPLTLPPTYPPSLPHLPSLPPSQLLILTIPSRPSFFLSLFSPQVMKPGYCRFSLTFWMSLAEIDYILDAVLFVAEHGWRFLKQYR